MAGRNAQKKLGVQALSFLLMMVPPAGIYLTIGQGQDVLTGVLLGLVAAGMLLAMLV